MESVGRSERKVADAVQSSILVQAQLSDPLRYGGPRRNAAEGMPSLSLAHGQLSDPAALIFIRAEKRVTPASNTAMHVLVGKT